MRLALTNNPLYPILDLIPYEWTSIKVSLLEDIKALLAEQGLHTKKLENIFAVLIWLEENKLVDLHEVVNTKTYLIRRVKYD